MVDQEAAGLDLSALNFHCEDAGATELEEQYAEVKAQYEEIKREVSELEFGNDNGEQTGQEVGKLTKSLEDVKFILNSLYIRLWVFRICSLINLITIVRINVN